MSLIEQFPSFTQEEINRNIHLRQARATVYIKENPTGQRPLAPDFEELLNDMEKLNSCALVQSLGLPNLVNLINSLELQLTNNGKVK